MAFYARDLADVHDIGFGGFASSAAPALVRLLRGAGHRDGLVVDLGCGSGILARALIDAGYEALGVRGRSSCSASTTASGSEATSCTT